MVKTISFIDIGRRVACVVAMIAHAIFLAYFSLIILGYALYPDLPRRWLLVLSVFLRYVPPIIVLLMLVARPWSSAQRGVALTICVVVISLSLFLVCFVGEGTFSRAIVAHKEDYLEGTLDVWCCFIVLLLCNRSLK